MSTPVTRTPSQQPAATTTDDGRRGVRCLLHPRSVAVIGASEGTRLGGVIVTLLIRHGFPGPVFPVNPKYDAVQGLPCYPDVASLPPDEPIDLAVVFVPAAAVSSVLKQCGERGVRAAVVVTSGFAEVGGIGVALQAELVEIARSYDMAISGPNCAGIANFTENVVAYGTTNFIELATIRTGSVAILTSSGGFGNTVFTYCQERSLGLSHLIGLGNEAVTDSAQFLDALVDDDAVSLILANLESIRDAPAFLAAADRAADRGKPVVVLKGGRSEAGQHAIATHTAALGGSPEAFAGAFRQHGIVQVTDLGHLVDIAVLLARCGPIRGNRVGIFSLAGGGAGLLSDLGADFGFTVPELDPVTVSNLTEVLPSLAVVKNPLDPTAGFARDPDRFAHALITFAADPAIDVVVFFPLASQTSYAEQLARTLVSASASIATPIVVVWTAGRQLADGAWRTLDEAGIPLFTDATDAFRALRAACDHYDFQERRRAERSPGAVADVPDLGPDLLSDPDLLPGPELLEGCGIQLPRSVVVTSAHDAARAVDVLGRAAMKIVSPDILHKTEAGGVELNIVDPAEAQRAFTRIMARCREIVPAARIAGVEVQQMVSPGLELLLGVHPDDDLGPVLTVAMGGVFTELLRDAAQRPVPISRSDAELMLSELAGARILDGFRGGPAYDKNAVIDAMLTLAALADRLRHRRPVIELNPLVVHEVGRGAVAVDHIVDFAPREATHT